MLKVELGQGQGRDRMEKWFKRAMDANPDNAFACGAKMLYLEPKWHGTPIDMITFARECFAGQNWQGTLPFEIELAYDNLLPYVDNAEAFYGAPAVWNDIESLYGPYMRGRIRKTFVGSATSTPICLPASPGSGDWVCSSSSNLGSALISMPRYSAAGT